jgi:hypothetical protein
MPVRWGRLQGEIHRLIARFSPRRRRIPRLGPLCCVGKSAPRELIRPVLNGRRAGNEPG